MMCIRFLLVGITLLHHLLSIKANEPITIRGAGASFPANVYKSWGMYFQTHRYLFMNIRMEYDSVGSGSGKAAITKVFNASGIYGKWEVGSGKFPVYEFTSPMNTKLPASELTVDYAGSDSLLKEEDYQRFPDLQIFPSMAGAVVLCYNLPGVTDLVVSREVLVGLYNGTIRSWNHMLLRELNPEVELPDVGVYVIARSDMSGTTEIFTKALSHFDANWNGTYGFFSSGLGPDDRPTHWNESAVSAFGYTNQGMAGLLLSIKYSVAYLSLAEAVDADIKYASILNREGRVVSPQANSIHEAMDATVGNFTDRFTQDLVDVNSQDAYPIVGYTYMILRMSSLKDCARAVQLYRYIDWFTGSDTAKRESEVFHMTSVSSQLRAKIQHDVLSRMQCRGQSVAKMVAKQIYQEHLSTQTWRLPVYIASPLAFLIIMGLLGTLAYQQLRKNEAVRRKEYMIPAAKIQLLTGKDFFRSVGSIRSLFRINGSSVTAGAKSMTSNDKVAKLCQTLAVFQEQEVSLRQVKLRPGQFNNNTKRSLLWIRDKIHHPNVQQFFGLTTLDSSHFLVTGCCHKGVLQDVLQNDHLKLDLNFRFSMSCDLASGLGYLHKQGVVHGCLTSHVCLIDARWTVKISDWQFCHLYSTQRDRTILHNIINFDSEVEESPSSKHLYWCAPEIVRDFAFVPTAACDVYSLGILIIEIFSREEPYFELSEQMQPKDIIANILNYDLRPALPTTLPNELRRILKQCWQNVPRNRPSANSVLRSLDRSKPTRKSVLDCMMEALERYAVKLEDQVAERTQKVTRTLQRLEELLYQMLPQSVATELALGRTVMPEFYDSVTIFFSDIVGFTALSAESSPLEMVTMLNELYTTLDSVIEKHEVYKVETIGDAYLFVSGCPIKNGDEHAVHIAKTVIDFAIVSAEFKIAHRPEQPLLLRVGIHTGSVAAGVVGHKMPRYCLFGDTVNTASRMESTSLAQKIQLSDATRLYLVKNDLFVFEPRGRIKVKGKGEMETFWLHGFKDNLVQLPPPFLRDCSYPQTGSF